jgi:hypothetical protein
VTILPLAAKQAAHKVPEPERQLTPDPSKDCDCNDERDQCEEPLGIGKQLTDQKNGDEKRDQREQNAWQE